MNITEHKIIKVTTSKTGKYIKNFLMFLNNILILFRQNFKELMLFLLFCTVFSATATFFLKQLLLDAMMKVSGTTFIATVNWRTVFFHPASILLMLVFGIVITLFSLF